MSYEDIILGNKKIGKQYPVYIIAEVGSNHNQNLEIAFNMIEKSARAGANAVKFQGIKFDKLYNKNIEEKSLEKWFEQIELNEDWYEKLNLKAKNCGIDFLCSPTYKESVDLLCKLDVPAIKIASPQVQGNPFLLNYAASSGKPLLLSLGYCDYGDILEAIKISENQNNKNIILLHCISKYPSLPEEMNLKFIKTLELMFKKPVGFSDHSLGSTMSIAAVTLGAKVLEKHVTLDSKSEGPDHHFAMNFEEFENYVKSIRDTEKATENSTRINFLSEELEYRNNVKLKMVSKINIGKNEEINEDNVIFLRASQDGIEFDQFKNFKTLLSRTRIPKDTLIKWKDLKFSL